MSNYFECTKDNPWDKTKGEFAKHKDAEEVYDDWEQDLNVLIMKHLGKNIMKIQNDLQRNIACILYRY